MINREEIAKNVQRLLQGYADSSNDIKITARTPKEADVYIDGKLFNTLCPPSKNRHKKASKNEMNRSISLIC